MSRVAVRDLDWHPPVMVLLGRVLIHTTGAISAMATLRLPCSGDRCGCSTGWCGNFSWHLERAEVLALLGTLAVSAVALHLRRSRDFMNPA
ncbi:hypothetical protein ACFYZ9_37500 [Streptomyces sp. NPDC001691]|uniref:hypothetical protein n=1 Tax=Streptomyces sp. NPDC001691 TaxID=3364600 RepID=UPI0036B9F7EC